MDMGGGKMTWTQGQSLTPLVCLCVCARVCAYAYITYLCVYVGFLEFQPLRVVHFVFRGNSFRRKRSTGRSMSVCFFGGVCVICSVGWGSREILVSEMLDPWGGGFLCVCVCLCVFVCVSEWGWN